MQSPHLPWSPCHRTDWEDWEPSARSAPPRKGPLTVCPVPQRRQKQVRTQIFLRMLLNLNTLTDPSIQLADSLFTFENLFLFVWSPCASPSCPSSPEPPGSSLQHRELFRPSAQHIREQQSVFFWSQRPPPLTAGSTKTRGHRQPVSGQHRPHEGKDLRYSKALQFVV